jgi:hypothetical protein
MRAQKFLGIVLILLTQLVQPAVRESGFFVGRANLKREALIGKKEVKRSHRNIPLHVIAWSG